MMERDAEGVIDIGHGVHIKFTVRGDHDEVCGIYESHECLDGEGMGAVTFDVPAAEGLPGPRWTVEQLDPLTISPSVLCGTCGNHGFIREGRWVPA